MNVSTFKDHYTKLIFYLTDHNPVLAEYYAKRSPIPIDQDVLDNIIKKNIQMKTKYNNLSVLKQHKIPTLDQFYHDINNLAIIFTYGYGNIKPNFYRAIDYIRILRLLGNEKYADSLTTFLYKQRNKKTVQTLNKLKKNQNNKQNE